MDNNVLKDVTLTLSLATGGIAVFGVVAALAFFGFAIRRIIKILSALTVFVFFVIAVPMTVSRLTQTTTYVSKAVPGETKILTTEIKRLDTLKILVTITLDRPGQAYLSYQGLVPSDAGNSKNVVHRFYVAKKNPAPEAGLLIIDGQERGRLILE